ncbi:MAG TPA: IPT/TIG domain-containing protein [Solirubrobacteraceae bacterium]|nr:IPT/TIG domain-containing protein [Solirubrobacteraceae bacterium]
MNHLVAAFRRPVCGSRQVVIAATLSLLVGLAFARLLAGAHTGPSEGIPSAASREALSPLPVAALGPLSQALGESGSAYLASGAGADVHAANPAQHLRLHFTRAAIVLEGARGQLALALRGIGYGDASRPVAPAPPQARANRVVYRHAGLQEWYANGPLGLEQGFTIDRPPAGDSAQPLTLSLALAGTGASATLASGGQSVWLGARGVSLRFGSLRASDATGRTLRSWLAVVGGRVLLRVDAGRARYPVRIDPLVQEGGGSVSGSGQTGSGQLGFSVAMSGDGRTAIIGAPRENSSAGAVWVFVRSGGRWREQAKLTTGEAGGEAQCNEQLAGEAGECGFGKSVALSGDGSTALIGGPRQTGPCPKGQCPAQGAAWVFVRRIVNVEGREEPHWELQSKLTGGEEEGAEGRFGHAVALSADGNTALIGAPGDGGGHGGAWVLTRSESTWTQQGPKLTGEEEAGVAHFGGAVALSSSGAAALVGGPADGEFAGAAWYLTRSGSAWSQKGPKITAGAGEQGAGHFGSSVALAADGSTALVGARADAGGLGAAWGLARSPEGTLEHQGEKLTPPEDAVGRGEFGFSVGLSSDGSAALIGAPRDSSSVGAAWEFAHSGASWTADGSKLAGVGLSEAVSRNGLFGASVALRADGASALVGAPAAAGKAGVVWTFADPATIPAVTGVSPTAGPTSGGTSVTISGMRLTGATAVSFGATQASFTVDPNGSITAISPPDPGGAGDTVHVTVTTPEGVSPVGPGDQFTYMQPPTVSGVWPQEGPAAGGTTVAISGSHLGGVTGVSFGAIAATSFTVNSAGSITAVSPPASAGTVDVRVTGPGGSSQESARDRFTFLSPGGSPGTSPGGSAGGAVAVTSASGGGTAGHGAAGGVLGFGPTCSATLVSRAISVLSHGRAAVKLLWRGGGTCRGRLRLSIRVRAGRRIGTRTIGTATFSLAAGRARTVAIKLNALGRSRLGAGHGRLDASLTIVGATPAALARTARVRLTVQRAHKPAARGR